MHQVSPHNVLPLPYVTFHRRATAKTGEKGKADGTVSNAAQSDAAAMAWEEHFDEVPYTMSTCSYLGLSETPSDGAILIVGRVCLA